MIPYDPSRDALLRPFLRDTVFAEGGTYSPLQIGVEAARLAYYPAESEPEHAVRLHAALKNIGFNEPTWFIDEDTDTQAFGAYRASDHTVLLAFRGTEPDKAGDISTDAQFWKTAWHHTQGQVHQGFSKAADALLKQAALKSYLAQHRGAHLIFAGHSLGAALAMLVASVHAPQTLVLIGSPRVGDADFNRSVQAQTVHRLVNCCDIITRIPPVGLNFAEVGVQAYIDAQGQVQAGWPRGDARIDADRAGARLAYLKEHAWRWNNVLVRDLADHAPINYIRAFFP